MAWRRVDVRRTGLLCDAAAVAFELGAWGIMDPCPECICSWILPFVLFSWDRLLLYSVLTSYH